VAGTLEYGIIGADEGIVSSERAPSGVREGSHLGIDEFVEPNVSIGGLEG
jgi:hypothetical protein